MIFLIPGSVASIMEFTSSMGAGGWLIGADNINAIYGRIRTD